MPNRVYDKGNHDDSDEANKQKTLSLRVRLEHNQLAFTMRKAINRILNKGQQQQDIADAKVLRQGKPHRNGRTYQYPDGEEANEFIHTYIES